MTDTIAITKAVQDILGSDAKVALTGGAVRDHLLGHTPHDFDFATDLRADDIIARFHAAGRKAVTIGARFGSVRTKVAVNGDFIDIDVTTFRTDGPGRKPVVSFDGVDLIADLARRDFTINAVALLADGTVVDPFGGVADLKAGILRAVGVPAKRFADDPLRILRLARFVAQLGFTVDAKTFKGATKTAPALLDISGSRVGQDLIKLLTGKHASAGLKLLADIGALPFILPDVATLVGFDQKSRFHKHDIFTHTLKVVDGIDRDPVLRLAALLHDVGKPAAKQDKGDRFTFVGHAPVGAKIAGRIVDDLQLGADFAFKVAALVARHLDDASPLKAADDAGKL